MAIGAVIMKKITTFLLQIYIFATITTSFHAHATGLQDLSTLDIVQENWEVVSGAFIVGFTFFFLIYVFSQSYEKKKFKKIATRDKAILSCAETLLEGEDSMEKLLEIICNYYQGEFVYIYEKSTKITDYQFGELTYIYTNQNSDKHRSFPLPTKFEKGSKWVQSFQEDPYIFLKKGDTNLHEFAPCDSFLADSTNSNVLVAPLKINGQLVGVLGVNNLRENAHSFQLITSVTAFITNNLEITYYRKDLEHSVSTLERKNLEHQAIFDCVNTLIYDENPQDAVYKLLQVICTYFGAERAYILQKERGEKNPADPDLSLEHQGLKYQEELVLFSEFLSEKGVKPSIANFHHISFQIISQWFQLLHENNTLNIHNIQKDIPADQHETKEFKLFVTGNTSRFVATPLFQKEEITGFLWVDNPTKNTDDISLLKTISAFIVNHLVKNKLHEKLENLSYSDSLTGLYNRNFYMTCVNRPEPYQNLGIIFADVNGLKKANDKIGHEYGDILLKWCGHFFSTHTSGHVFRIGGDEFVCFMENINQNDFEMSVKFLQTKLKSYGDVHVSIGSVWASSITDVEAQVREADKRMYEVKQEYYKEKAADPRTEEKQLVDFTASIAALEAELNNNLFDF